MFGAVLAAQVLSIGVVQKGKSKVTGITPGFCQDKLDKLSDIGVRESKG